MCQGWGSGQRFGVWEGVWLWPGTLLGSSPAGSEVWDGKGPGEEREEWGRKGI